VLWKWLRPTLSGVHVVHSDIHVKFWAQGVPSVERVRPGRCPCCRAAARPLGEGLSLIGHGVRERQVRGPRRVGAPPELLVIVVRRYRCRRCRAVCTVLPRGVVRRRHFGAGAIGWALFVRGYEDLPSRQIRELVGGMGRPEASSWVTLGRWLRAVESGRLFHWRAAAALATPRQRAEHTAMMLVSFAPPELASAPLAEQAFVGADWVAHVA